MTKDKRVSDIICCLKANDSQGGVFTCLFSQEFVLLPLTTFLPHVSYFSFLLIRPSSYSVFCHVASICLGSFYIKSWMCVELVIYLEDDFGTSQLCVYLTDERTPACCTTPKCSQSPLESSTRPKRCHLQSGYTEVCLPKKNSVTLLFQTTTLNRRPSGIGLAQYSQGPIK